MTTYRVLHNDMAENPRQYDDISVMVCAHRRYDLGDKGAERPPKDAALVKPIYMYDHSGLAFSHSPFACQWDSGQLGEHYITKEVFEKHLGSDMAAAEEHLKQSLKEYADWVEGNVWTLQIGSDDDAEHMDGAGTTLEETGFLTAVPAVDHAKLREAWDKRFETKRR